MSSRCPHARPKGECPDPLCPFHGAIVDRPAPPHTAAPVDLDSADEAERKMTPGPWAATVAPTSPAGGLLVFDIGPDADATIATTCGDDTESIDAAEHNAAGIVALRNAAPALIAELAALRAKLAEATSLLRSAGDLFVEIQATDGEDEHKAITDGAKLSAAIAAALEAL